MNFCLAGRLVTVAALTLAATGCSAASSDDEVTGPAMSDLAPSYDARTPADTGRNAQTRERKPGREGGTDMPEQPASTSSPHPLTTPTAGTKAGAAQASRTRPRAVGNPGTSRISDPTGDLSSSVEGAPAAADIVAVRLTRRGEEIEVRTTFAGAVPAKQDGSKGMNVASFYDVDGNGMIDYEVWVSLADSGWGTGHLDDRENQATFGPATGIKVAVEGSTLVTRFPLDRIGGAETFRWSAASEWGSYESMSASTSARDYAPDEGAVDYTG